MKAAIVASLLMALGASEAVAGPMSGGGGKAVACFDQAGKLTSATLLDLFEGEAEFGDTRLAAAGQTVDQVLAVATQRLAHTGYLALIPGLIRLDDAVAHVRATLRLLPAGVALEPIDDSFHDIAPAGCRVVQAAHFIDQDNIVADRALWEAFSDLDRAALVLHEAVYWLDRTLRDVRDSRRSRRTVSLALGAKWDFLPVDDGMPTTYDLCQTLGASAGSADPLTFFAVYEQNGFQITQFLLLNGDALLSKTVSYTLDFPFLEPEDASVSVGWHGSTTTSLYENGHKLDFSRDPVVDATGHIAFSALTFAARKVAYPEWQAPAAQIMCLPVAER